MPIQLFFVILQIGVLKNKNISTPKHQIIKSLNTIFPVFGNGKLQDRKESIMKKHNGMRPHDIVILLKMITLGGKKISIEEMADCLNTSISEVSRAMDRNVIADLVSSDKARVNKLALRDFLIYGLKYVFPPQLGSSTRGVPTAHSAPPVNQYISEGNENYVWKYYKGTKRGSSIEPLYPKVPIIVEGQLELYELLAIADTFRIGKRREIDIATKELDKRLEKYVE